MTDKSYRLSINTQILKRDSLIGEVEKIIDFLKRNRIARVHLIYGWVPDLGEGEQGQDAIISI